MPRPKTLDDSLPVGFRLPAALVARIDAYVERMESQMPGASVSRSNAIRALLVRGLDAEGIPEAAAEQPEKPAKPRRK